MKGAAIDMEADLPRTPGSESSEMDISDALPSSSGAGSASAREWDAGHAPGPRGDDGAHWARCLDIMRASDEKMIKRWNEELDSLLLFAALFSAIVTTFVVDSYKSLQPGPELTGQAVTHLAIRISTLASTSGSPNSALNSTPYTFSVSSSSTSPTAVRVNALWFSSLVISLSTALFGIFGKQWLRVYIQQDGSSPQVCVRTRQFYYDGLLRWHIPRFMTLMPVLLQAALVLFLIGLVDLLWTLNSAVAGTITALAACAISMAVVVSILPAFYATCPYVSPLSSVMTSITWALTWSACFLGACSLSLYRVARAMIWNRSRLRGQTMGTLWRFARRQLRMTGVMRADEATRKILHIQPDTHVVRALPADVQAGVLDACAVKWMYTLRNGIDNSTAEPLILSCFSSLEIPVQESLVIELAAAEHGVTSRALLEEAGRRPSDYHTAIRMPAITPPERTLDLLHSMLRVSYQDSAGARAPGPDTVSTQLQLLYEFMAERYGNFVLPAV